MAERFEKVRQEGKKMRDAMRQQTIGYITAALGLVAGLAWNQAIQALISRFFPNSKSSLTALFIYAIAVTVLVVVLTTYIVRIFQKQESKNGDGGGDSH